MLHPGLTRPHLTTLGLPVLTVISDQAMTREGEESLNLSILRRQVSQGRIQAVLLLDIPQRLWHACGGYKLAFKNKK